MSDKLSDGYGGTLPRKCQEQMEREGASELDAPSGSATGEPRVKTLLRSMITALDRDDADTYWTLFEMLLRLHEEMFKAPEDK